MTRPSALASSAAGARELRMHIKRLVVDAAVLGPMTPVALGEQLRAALAMGQAAPEGAPRLNSATRIHVALVPRIAERLESVAGRNDRV